MLEVGKTDKAQELLDESTNAFAQFNFPIFEAWFCALNAEAIRRTGDLKMAASAAQKSLAISERINHSWGMAWAHGVLGHLSKELLGDLSPDEHRSRSEEIFRELENSI